MTARILAFVVPLAILGAASAGLALVTDEITTKNLTNAGMVLNGAVYGRPAVEVMADAIDRVQPEILVIGNSYANTNLDVDAIEGVTHRRVLKLTVPNTIGTHWYAMLDNLVYQRGHRPEIVVVFADIQSALLVQPPSEASALNLEAQLDGDDPAVAAHVIGRDPRWARITANRVLVRDQLLAQLRDAGARAVLGLQGREVGETTVLAALDRVLGDGATDPRLRDVAPLAGTIRAVDLVDPELVPEPAASMLPEIAELCRDHGSRLLVIRTPMSPEIPPSLEIPEGTIPALNAALAARDAVLVDLTPLPMREGHYELNAHMTPEGAVRTTRAFHRVLAELDWIDDDAGPAADVIGGVQLRDGVLALPVSELAFAAAPVRLHRDPLVAVDGDVARIAIPELDGVTDERTLAMSPLARRCSPVRVLEDGLPLPLPNTRCDEVRQFHGGRSCHVALGVMFATVDGTLPRDNGRKYRLALDPDRTCDNSAWLYPGDRLTARVGADQLARLTTAATQLRVGFRSTQADVPIRVRVIADGEIALDTVVSEDGRIPLTVAVPQSAQDVTVRIAHGERGLVLLTRLALEAP